MLCFVFAALVVLLDQFFKGWIVRSLEVFENMDLIPGIISLTHIQNSGAAFSILANHRWLLAGIAFVASIVIVFILLRYTEGFWGTLGLSAVLGGAVGNLVDRVVHGYVIDMFHADFLKNFAIFNIADIFITLGFTTFCIHFIITSFKAASREKEDLKRAAAENIATDDEEFAYTDEPDQPDFDDFSDTKVIPSGLSEQRDTAPERYRAEQEPRAFPEQPPEQDQKVLLDWREYYETTPESTEETSSALEAISALDELESQLGLGEDLDVDKLLQEYGFEDDFEDNKD